MRAMRALIVIAALTRPAVAEPVYCLVWNGIRTCSSPDGYVSHETTWSGITTGDDNQGVTWRRSEWQGREIITVTPRKRGDA
jgi:hypothetical protein